MPLMKRDQGTCPRPHNEYLDGKGSGGPSGITSYLLRCRLTPLLAYLQVGFVQIDEEKKVKPEQRKLTPSIVSFRSPEI